MTEIQRFDGSTWVDIRYQDFEIEYGLSDVLVAPKATVDTDVRETVNSGEELRIQEGGTTIFKGRLTSSGKRRSNGSRKLKAEHRAYELFEESVSFTSVSPTANDVLDDALAASNIGEDFTLTFAADDVTLGDDYEADNRSLKRVFRDITDRTGTVWWVAGASDEITVDDYGGRGLWESITTATDTARVLSYDPDNVETVVNDVTVNGTSGERVTGSDSDSTSISEYGRRPQTVNVSYVTSQTEADDYASALLNPDPLPEAELLIGGNVGTDPESNLSNYEVAVDDSNGTGLDNTLVVEKQTVEQGQVRLDIGEGRATSVAKFNRSEKSKGDNSEPGSVYDSDRIADGAIGDTKLVDLSVTEEKLADLAVSLQKVQDDAIDTVKIRDNAIEAPKILAEAITAEKLDTDLARANRLLAGEIEAIDIQTGTLTANEIATLDLETQQISVGSGLDGQIEFDDLDIGSRTVAAMLPSNDNDCLIGFDALRFQEINGVEIDAIHLLAESGLLGSSADTRIEIRDLGGETALSPEIDGECQLGDSSDGYSSVWASQFVDSDDGTVVAGDGGDPLKGLAADPTPPEHCRPCDDDGNALGVSINELAKTAYELCSAQQRRIEDLESRIADLEAALSE